MNRNLASLPGLVSGCEERADSLKVNGKLLACRRRNGLRKRSPAGWQAWRNL